MKAGVKWLTTAILAAGLSTLVVGGWGGSDHPSGLGRTSTTPASQPPGVPGLASDAPSVGQAIPEDVGAAITLAAGAPVIVLWPDLRCGPLGPITLGMPVFHERLWLSPFLRNGPESP